MLIATNQTYAATTKGGYPICFQKEWLNDLIHFLAQNDRSNYDSYMKTEKCLVSKNGIRVAITEWPGIFGTTTGFVVGGIKVWTLREGINYND